MKIEQMDPKKIIPYARNAKKHSKQQVKAILAQILSFGFDQPIVVDKEMVIIKGHGRREAAIQGNLVTVPVVVADHLSEDEVRAARIGDNKVSEGQEWDKELLKFEIATLERNEFNLELTGFELAEIEKLDAEPVLDRGAKADGGSQGADESGGDGDGEASQFIVTAECRDEEEMRTLYEELQGRGMKVRLIT